MNTRFPPPRRLSGDLKRKFDFEYDTSVIDLQGNYFRVLVVFYEEDHFELWNLDLGILVEIGVLPRRDQINIHRYLDERIRQENGYREKDVITVGERLAELREMNETRGLK